MTKRILLVEDEQSLRELMQEAFEREGYEVHSAENADEAQKILKKHRINVMFLDLKLPGTNGVELGREIRKNNPIASLFAVTGYVSLFELAECREAGFDDYFIKPAKLEDLMSAAEMAFKKLERWKAS